MSDDYMTKNDNNGPSDIHRRQGKEETHVNPLGRCFCCGKPIYYMDKACTYCKQPNRGWKRVGENQCGNCHAYFEEGDKYCRICGTKTGDGAYDPYQDLMVCIYGPMPVERAHKCTSCGYRWKTMLMVDDQEFCPKCGGRAKLCGKRAFIQRLSRRC